MKKLFEQFLFLLIVVFVIHQQTDANGETGDFELKKFYQQMLMEKSPVPEQIKHQIGIDILRYSLTSKSN
uniref:Uncharacterized protein n=1 Tax=Globodera rostochiensis TaxID=31243 RepID=A0A914I0G7_GLORO